ncbi:aspartate aminotransferase family protein [Bacteroidota bacterium]
MNRKDIFLKHTAQTSKHPLLIEIDHADGIYLTGKDGKKYLDLISGIGVSNIGHRHPRIVEAVKKQVDKHMHVIVYGEMVQDPQTDLAEKLQEFLPHSLDCYYFVNSGTEANEAALKLVKRCTGRSEIISFRRSYHGSTHGSLSVTGNEEKKSAFRPLLPSVKFLDFNIPEQLPGISNKTAGVIIEPVQGDAGVRIPDGSYMKALRNRCTETGTLLIFDEIQTGFGRTGKLFAFEHFDVVPDILTMAKAMGGGMPIGAMASSKDLMSKFTHNPALGHITTFGGHPVNCAAALANLQVLTETNLIEETESKGQLFEELLIHDRIVEIRRLGLMIAVELESEDMVTRVIKRCLDKGVIIYWFLSTRNSFRIAPPLTISEEEIRTACSIIRQNLDDLD